MSSGTHVFKEMLGKTFKLVHKDKNDGNDRLTFITETGEAFRFYHEQDCCEDVWIDAIVGDLEDLMATPLLIAQEVWSNDDNKDEGRVTWTFYTFATSKGSVTVRWCGSSNGYYSESVDFHHEDLNGEAIATY